MDDVIKIVMKKLNMEIPQFKLNRWCEVKQSGSDIKVQGIDKLGRPFDLFTKKSTRKLSDDQFEVSLRFQGHYNEQDLNI